MFIWKIPEANQALIITGSRAGEQDFKIVTGRRAVVMPVLQKSRFFNLDLHQTEIEVKCVTKQGIPVVAKAVVAYKVADDEASIANAARRFLDQQQLMDSQVHNIFTGHLRSIIGNLTVEELITNRDKLEQETRNSSAPELQTLGLLLDSLKIQELDDPTNYIQNLAKPHLAEAERNARIAQAQNNQAAASAEADAQANVAQAQRDSQIKQAGYEAEIDQAKAKASQAGPLAEAAAQADVVKNQTAVAELEADRTDKQLDATVRKPADAAKYQRIAQAEADKQASILQAEADAQRVSLEAGAQAEQTQKVGEAEGAAIRARGEAEGAALQAKADGLKANQDAVIGQTLAGQAVEIVRAAAHAFDNVDNMTVLNGSDGLMNALNSVITTALTSIGTVRSSLEEQAKQNGSTTKTPEAVGLGTGR